MKDPLLDSLDICIYEIANNGNLVEMTGWLKMIMDDYIRSANVMLSVK